jgi:hypothetical protein
MNTSAGAARRCCDGAVGSGGREGHGAWHAACHGQQSAERPIFGEFASIACTSSRDLIMAGDRAGELQVRVCAESAMNVRVKLEHAYWHSVTIVHDGLHHV